MHQHEDALAHATSWRRSVAELALATSSPYSRRQFQRMQRNTAPNSFALLATLRSERSTTSAWSPRSVQVGRMMWPRVPLKNSMVQAFAAALSAANSMLFVPEL